MSAAIVPFGTGTGTGAGADDGGFSGGGNDAGGYGAGGGYGGGAQMGGQQQQQQQWQQPLQQQQVWWAVACWLGVTVEGTGIFLWSCRVRVVFCLLDLCCLSDFFLKGKYRLKERYIT